MNALRAHADAIAQQLTADPATIGHVMRANHTRIGVHTAHHEPVTIGGLGTFRYDNRHGVIFEVDIDLAQHVLHARAMPTPTGTISDEYAALLSDDAQVTPDLVRAVLDAHTRLIARMLVEGAPVAYQGFGRYQPDKEVGVRFHPGSTLVSMIDNQGEAPRVAPPKRAHSTADMAHFIDKAAEENPDAH